MNLEALLASLTDQERNFIAGLDYGNDAKQHRLALDEVITGGGVDFESRGYWYPYEVIELGKNWLQSGHEREYAVCMGIVLRNVERGTDKSNDLEWIIENQADSIAQLPPELKALITGLADTIINKCEPDRPVNAAARRD